MNLELAPRRRIPILPHRDREPLSRLSVDDHFQFAIGEIDGKTEVRKRGAAEQDARKCQKKKSFHVPELVQSRYL